MKILKAEDFRELARAYFNNEQPNLDSGICFALADFLAPSYSATDLWYNTYDAVVPLLLIHGWDVRHNDYLGNKAPSGTYKGWEPRAWTCLLLAEQMENPYDEI